MSHPTFVCFRDLMICSILVSKGQRKDLSMNVMDMFSLKGKCAVVTGGSVGLGAQIATALAEAGADIVIAARKVERCQLLADELAASNGVRTLAVSCDAAKNEDCENLIDTAVKEFGKVDILVNNAGISWVAPSLDFPMDKWQKVMNLNVNGVFYLSMLAARKMKEQGGGKIINVASIGGLRGDYAENVDSVAYTASKGAVINLTRDLACKWASYNINVNSISPGWFPTSLNDQLLEKRREELIPRIPAGRYGNENDLKGVAVLLASAASDYITGQNFIIDGGQTSLS